MKFLLQAIRDPQHIGAFTPSSKRLAELITDNADLENAKIIVELGPGEGVFTKQIIKKRAVDSVYFTIEHNLQFTRIMKFKYPHIETFHNSAEHIEEYLHMLGYNQCDRIISGLPWTAFDDALQETILSHICKSLAPAGLFLTFSYYPFNYLSRGTLFRQKLYDYFSDVKETKIVMNFPPAFVYICRK